MDDQWKPTKIDLFISGGITLLLPVFAGFLLKHTGAIIPMIIYYGIAWGVVKWRRGDTGYSLKKLSPPPLSFYIHIIVIVIILIFAYFARINVVNSSIIGVVFTGLVWAVCNASSEQLLWIYIFDSWTLYKKGSLLKNRQLLMGIIGFLLFSVFVGTIHTMYWGKFLHTINPKMFFGVIFIIGTSLSGYLHVIVWRQSSRMIYTFIPHFLLNLVPLFWTGYSIIPYLFKPVV